MGGVTYVEQADKQENKTVTGVEAPSTTTATETSTTPTAQTTVEAQATEQTATNEDTESDGEAEERRATPKLTGKQLRDILNGLSEADLDLPVTDDFGIGLTAFMGVETFGTGTKEPQKRLVFESGEF